MALGSEAVLYDTDGSPLAVDHGVATPADTPLIMIGGSDGTNSRYIVIDSSGRQVMVGAGSAGSPAGGIITIQGDVSGTPIPVSGTVSATQSGTWTVQPGNTANTTPWLMTINQGGNSATVTASNALKIDGSAVTQPVSDAGGSLTIDTLQLPSSLVDGRLDTNVGAWLGSTAPTVGQKTMANSLPVVVASDQSTLTVKEIRSTTSTTASVTSSGTTVTLRVSNSNRLGLTVENAANKTLYLKLGSSASTTDYTVKMVKDAYYEVPYGYTGIVTGIWEAGPTGSAYITELT